MTPTQALVWASAGSYGASNVSALGARAVCTMVTLPLIALVPPRGGDMVGIHEADERVEARRAELHEEGRLARLHPVVLQLVPSMVEVCVQLPEPAQAA